MILNKEQDKTTKRKYKLAMLSFDRMFETPSNEILRLKQENTILQNEIIRLKQENTILQNTSYDTHT